LPPPPPPPLEPVFPSPAPASLPPFPSGWCFDEPPPQEVVDRAWALLPSLWAKGVGSRQIELVGGRWITFVATQMGAQKGVTAWRAQNCAPAPAGPVVPKPVPSSGPVPPVRPSPAPSSPTVQPPAAPPHANPAPIAPPPYIPASVPPVVVQTPAGSNPYGGTMSTAQVQAAVNTMGYTPALVVDGKYGHATTAGVRWAQGQLNLSGYVPVLVVDGKAGQKTQDTMIEAGAAGTPAVPPATPTPPRAPSSPMGAADIQRAVNAMGYAPALATDGKLGPKSVAGIKWAQQHLNAQGWHPALAVDGIAGPQTQAALEAQTA
jgi:peptidoglycan hydrolase-like protein with peptidoglycan-binding domain